MDALRGLIPDEPPLNDFVVGGFRCLVKQTATGTLVGIITDAAGEVVHTSRWPASFSVKAVAREMRETALRLKYAH